MEQLKLVLLNSFKKIVAYLGYQGFFSHLANSLNNQPRLRLPCVIV